MKIRFAARPFRVPLLLTVLMISASVAGCCASAFSLRRSSGTSSGAEAAPNNTASLTIDPVGHFTFVARLDAEPISSFQIDPATGKLRAVESLRQPVAMGDVDRSAGAVVSVGALSVIQTGQ